MSDHDPYALLGVPHDATAADVTEARRRLAKQAHPDLGGSVAAMQEINAAAAAVLTAIGASTTTPESAGRRPRGRSTQTPHAGGRAVVDHPSFTIETLPVDAFEALAVVAAELGTLIDDDPPYRLEFALEGDWHGWCEVTLVPDAGSTTASIEVAAEPGFPPPAVESVRDALVDGLNRLDWSDGPAQRP